MNLKCPGCDIMISSPASQCPNCKMDLRPLLHARETADYYFNQGLEACNQEHYLSAFESLAVARALNPTDVQTWILTGKLCIKAGDNKRAVHYFKQALKLNASSAEAQGALNWLLSQGCEVIL